MGGGVLSGLMVKAQAVEAAFYLPTSCNGHCLSSGLYLLFGLLSLYKIW